MMQTGKAVGMQVMDDSIQTLYEDGRISAAEAYKNANNSARFKPFWYKENEGKE